MIHILALIFQVVWSSQECVRPDQWCAFPGSEYSNKDCDGDNIPDHSCVFRDEPFLFIGSNSGCTTMDMVGQSSFPSECVEVSEGCQPQISDTMFVLDSSKSLSLQELGDEINFAERLVQGGMKEGSRGAVMQFSDGHITMQDFTDDLDAVVAGMDAINANPIRRATKTGPALEEAVALIRGLDNRNGRKQRMVLITDGVPNPAQFDPCGANFPQLGADIDDLEIEVLVVAVGMNAQNAADAHECLVKDVDTDVFVYEQFDELLQRFEDPQGRLCSNLETGAPTPSPVTMGYQCYCFGDPHCMDWAGTNFDYMQTGEYIFYDGGDDMTILARYSGSPRKADVSSIEAIRFGGERFCGDWFELHMGNLAGDDNGWGPGNDLYAPRLIVTGSRSTSDRDYLENTDAHVAEADQHATIKEAFERRAATCDAYTFNHKRSKYGFEIEWADGLKMKVSKYGHPMWGMGVYIQAETANPPTDGDACSGEYVPLECDPEEPFLVYDGRMFSDPGCDGQERPNPDDTPAPTLPCPEELEREGREACEAVCDNPILADACVFDICAGGSVDFGFNIMDACIDIIEPVTRPTGRPTPSPEDPGYGNNCYCFGDPHCSDFTGVKEDWMSVGEFSFWETRDLSIQTRFIKSERKEFVSSTGAVAFGGDMTCGWTLALHIGNNRAAEGKAPFTDADGNFHEGFAAWDPAQSQWGLFEPKLFWRSPDYLASGDSRDTWEYEGMADIRNAIENAPFNCDQFEMTINRKGNIFFTFSNGVEVKLTGYEHPMWGLGLYLFTPDGTQTANDGGFCRGDKTPLDCNHVPDGANMFKFYPARYSKNGEENCDDLDSWDGTPAPVTDCPPDLKREAEEACAVCDGFEREACIFDVCVGGSVADGAEMIEACTDIIQPVIQPTEMPTFACYDDACVCPDELFSENCEDHNTDCSTSADLCTSSLDMVRKAMHKECPATCGLCGDVTCSGEMGYPKGKLVTSTTLVDAQDSCSCELFCFENRSEAFVWSQSNQKCDCLKKLKTKKNKVKVSNKAKWVWGLITP